MRAVIELMERFEDTEVSLLERILTESEAVFVKKLSTNDRDWARLPNKHQAGVYVPPAERDSGFFPPLSIKQRDGARAGDAEIRETFFRTEWPQVGVIHESRLVHYTSKGTETHLTRLPKEAFRDLAPASFLVIGKVALKVAEPVFRCVTVDSTSDEAGTLEGALSLEPDFLSAIRIPRAEFAAQREKALSFLELALRALHQGNIAAFAAEHAVIPPTEEIATLARKRYLVRENIPNLNPFELSHPGDVIRQISRGDEYEIFKDLQLKAKSLELVRMIVGDVYADASVEKVIATIVIGYPRIDALLLSASQQRKSRAGYSFEHQIEQMLRDGAVPFEKQVIIEAKKKPDFILPSFALFKDKKRKKSDALVLSLKTTLRERWKQVQREILNCDLFLATVDENIAANAIEDMRSLGIALVVPESLKKSEATEYEGHANVIDFKTFFEDEIRAERMPRWIEYGLTHRGLRK